MHTTAHPSLRPYLGTAIQDSNVGGPALCLVPNAAKELDGKYSLFVLA